MNSGNELLGTDLMIIIKEGMGMSLRKALKSDFWKGGLGWPLIMSF